VITWINHDAFGDQITFVKKRRFNKEEEAMILRIYTIIHTLISLAAIFTGLIVLFGMLSGKRLDGWTKWFLITAVATNGDGFLFPFSWFHTSHWAGDHLAAGTRVCDLRPLLAASRWSLALDLRR